MTEQPKDGGAAFDLAQMIADREAGTPGEWTTHQGWSHIVCPIDHFARPYGGAVDESRDRNNYAHVIAMADRDRHGRGDNHANARRIARVPLLEAEIIRLTARVAELEGALKPLADMAERYDPDDGDDGQLECWSGLAVPKIHHLRTARAALSTPTEDIKL